MMNFRVLLFKKRPHCLPNFFSMGIRSKVILVNALVMDGLLPPTTSFLSKAVKL